MAGLTLALDLGDRALITVPSEDEEGQETQEVIEVTVVSIHRNHVKLAIVAPEDFEILRERD